MISKIQNPLAPYAVVTSTDKGYLYTATALINSLLAYDNHVMVYLIYTPDVPASYLETLPQAVIPVALAGLLMEQEAVAVASDPTRGLPWQVRFLRYYVAYKVIENHQAVAIFDSDSFVCANLEHVFRQAVAAQVPVMVENPVGQKLSPDMIPEHLTKANHPPFHCHAAFFVERHRELLRQTFLTGKAEPYGDMVTLFRTILRQPVAELQAIDILPLPNLLWCGTKFNTEVMDCDGRDLPVIKIRNTGERVFSVHGRWHRPDICQQELNSPFRAEGSKVIGQANLELFKFCYKWYNDYGPITWFWGKDSNV